MNTPPLKANKSELLALFKENSHRLWFFVKPGGNWGDQLIYAGAESLARTIGLKWIDLDYLTFNPSRIPENAAIYLHGSGGFNPWGSRRAFSNLRNALSIRKALVIQGPQTADITSAETINLFHDATASVKASEVFFFARELNTRSFLTNILPRNFQLGLDHDTAFHLTKKEILELAELKHMPECRYSLLASRTDDEAPSSGPLSKRSIVIMDPAYFAQSFGHWLRIHAYARSVVSNRLHSAIVSALLDKPVILMAGNYHKNRSIWEYSLSDRGVEWRENLTLPNAQKRPIYTARNILLRSWKLRQFRMWLKGVPLR